MSLTIGSLFSGIGGLELGLEWAGLGPVVWQCEIDPFARGILARHWPDAIRYEDVRAIGADAPPVDIICGGFPCQDISNAGKRAGIGGERSGLWSEYARIVGLLRPRFVVVENVSALLGRGMDRVLGDLSALGYDAEWSALRASDVGAPHRRERIFIIACVADAASARLGESGRIRHGEQRRWAEPADRGALGDADRARLEGRSVRGGGCSDERPARPAGDAPVADTGCLRGERRGELGELGEQARAGEGQGAQRQRDGDPACDGGAVSGTLAHGHGHGCEGERRGGLLDRERTALRRDADRCGGAWGVGDPAGARRGDTEEAGADRGDASARTEEARRRPAGHVESERAGDGRSPEPGMGRGSHGIPSRVDRWPARPGEAQYDWEPPRVVQTAANRARRLKALGNAVVPQCAEVVGRVIQQMLLR